MPNRMLVIPVRTVRPILIGLVAVMATLAASHLAQAQTYRKQTRSAEKSARAAWRPVRQAKSVQPMDLPTPEPDLADSQILATGSSDRVRQVDHVVDPMPPLSGSIIEPQPAPLDGQIVLAPVHDDSCDAMLSGGACGCGACDSGGCDSIGCDGGCGSGTCCGELCSPNAWRPCVTFCMPQDGWFSAEYLLWTQDGMSLPPLVTSSTGTVDRVDAGVLGRSSTVVLFGGDEILDDTFDGARLRFGVWLDNCHRWGVGAEWFGLSEESENFSQTSSGSPILARPFRNTTNQSLEDSELVAFPGVVSGTVAVNATSELDGWGVHFRRFRQADEGCSRWFFCGCPEHFCSRTETMFGYRGLELQERVAITENLVSTDTSNPGSFDILDQFDTRNQFNGIDLGWTNRRVRGFWNFDTSIRLALGNTNQTVTINGNTTITDPNSTPTVQSHSGGLLAQTSNIGTYEQDEFTVVPELNFGIGYQLTDNLKATFGYTFIYWSNVVRPGEHISRFLNTELLPPPIDPITGAQLPEFEFDTTDYWAQGVSFGAEYRW
ncbi:MAG: BBP7 family outer membrane beta-barrel protein [Planctomycetota bacterium]